MKNISKLLGILAIVLVFGLTFTGCKEDAGGDILDGTIWVYNTDNDGLGYIHLYLLEFNSPDFTFTFEAPSSGEKVTIKGTYVVDGATVTLKSSLEPFMVETGTLSGDRLTFYNSDNNTKVFKINGLF